MSTKVRFWGVRGSIASPGAETAGVGGNTSCVEIMAGETRLICDAGTGMRGLGQAMVAEGPGEATLLLSHLHWDHIQGLPFFLPAYVPGNRIAVVGRRTAEMGVGDALEQQMRAPVFPVRFGELAADVGFHHVVPGQAMHVGGAVVRCAAGNHPGGVLAYRIEHEGRAVVYATDTEHYSCIDPALLALARGADVLIYDAQYTPEEYAGAAGRSKVGWGHSTWEAATQLAERAGVSELVLFHHDPQRTDEGVAAIEGIAQARFRDTVAAREGLTLTLPGIRESRAA
ncbi:MAG: MBL fold metallo-hydrolase [Deltaproteobacteria bacterium]|nr:MBL fold metallo-hydrolase [Deltaproteobacteria bacterium]